MAPRKSRQSQPQSETEAPVNIRPILSARHLLKEVGIVFTDQAIQNRFNRYKLNHFMREQHMVCTNWVLDVYTEAGRVWSKHRDPETEKLQIQGKVVDMSYEGIRTFLGLPEVRVCEYQKMLLLSETRVKEMTSSIYKNDDVCGWKTAQKHFKKMLLPQVQVYYDFLVRNIWQSSQKTEVNRDHIKLIYLMSKGKSIDFAWVIHSRFWTKVGQLVRRSKNAEEGKSTPLEFPCMITGICEVAGFQVVGQLSAAGGIMDDQPIPETEEGPIPSRRVTKSVPSTSKKRGPTIADLMSRLEEQSARDAEREARRAEREAERADLDRERYYASWARQSQLSAENDALASYYRGLHEAQDRACGRVVEDYPLHPHFGIAPPPEESEDEDDEEDQDSDIGDDDEADEDEDRDDVEDEEEFDEEDEDDEE